MTPSGKALANAAVACLGLAAVAAARAAVARWAEASLAGQVALITGGSRGLGLALARELVVEGCRLAISARDEAELERAREELSRDGAGVLAVPCDVADRTAVAAMVEAVVARFGRIDLLVNNAGIIAVAPITALSADDFERVMAVNFWGVLNATLAVLPAMRERRSGRIVNITSIGGKVAVPHMLPYTASKFAAVGFSEGLRAELARDGIAVMTVVPGEMRTGSHLHAEFGGDRQAEYRWFALGASAPVTMKADRAARIIVGGIKRGASELTYPLSAVVASRLNGLAPGAVGAAAAFVARLMPAADGGPAGTLPGAAIDPALRSPLWDAATALGRAAARDFNQIPAADAGGASAGR